ncbi:MULTISPECIES: imelysin family protein [Thermus]|uniref:Iron-regulated protein A n=1 Tax=Thermus brockianus TaxID=56956 RepID=A0A1J0LW22_THEBO|nr:imelysin family protein [Thermus brockianus]APD10392.1 Iron-regulated protein A [Thermus brockianus]
MRRYVLWAVIGLLGMAGAQGLKEGLAATVSPLLEGLVGQTRLLAQASEAYAANPSTEGLHRLQLLWHAARDYWEELEAFAFGPVGDYDPYLDTWPISLEDLKRSVGVPVENLPPEVRGFHALEYLLFQEPPQDAGTLHHLVLLAQDLARQVQALRERYGAYLETASDEELAAELYAASLELAEELFAEKLKNPESPYARRSAEDYQANGRGLAQALALLPTGGTPWALALALRAALADLPSPLEEAWGDSRVAKAQAQAEALYQALAKTPVGGAKERARLWLRTFREEYLGEGEVDEGLAALEGLEMALQSLSQREEAQQILEVLRSKVQAGAPAEEVDPLVRALEDLLR